MKRNLILWSLIPVWSTLYQSFIKLAAGSMGGMEFGPDWLKQAAATPWMWAALASEAAAFITWMKILSSHDLSKAFPLSAISYVMVLATGCLVFHEALLPLQLAGGALILAGVWLIGMAGKHSDASQ